MAETQFNTRIQLKIDTWENWTKDDAVILKNGEPGFVRIPPAAGQMTTEASDTILFKIGDGTTAFKNLPWPSALAGDVHDWAKAETRPTYAAGDITGIDAYIANYVNEQMGISVDTDTQYQIIKDTTNTHKYLFQSKGKLDASWATVAELDFKGYADDIADIEERVDAIEEKIGTATLATTDKTVIGAINEIREDVNEADNRCQAVENTLTGVQEDITEEVTRATNAESALGKRIDDLNNDTIGNTGDLETRAKDIVGAINEVHSDVDGKVASVTAKDKSVVIGGTATAPTVGVQLSAGTGNALTLASDGLMVTIPAAAEYSVVKDATAASGYAATYHLTKGGVNVGTAINIPKDMVVESGTVVTNPAGQAAGTYIKLVLANANEDTLYIPVDTLIEYVTSGSQTGDMVVITVSDDHKVTAEITDGTITIAKLATAVQTKINQAHEHDNKALLDTYTQTEANLKDAVDKKHAHGNKEELDKIASGDKAKWDGAVDWLTNIRVEYTNGQDFADEIRRLDTAATAAKNEAVQAAKDYTDEKLGEAQTDNLDFPVEQPLTGVVYEDMLTLDNTVYANAVNYTDTKFGSLSAVAVSGSMADLKQYDDDPTIVFYCGTASTVI